MPRKNQVYQTYGRHRHRVVSVDIWGVPDGKTKQNGPFSSFSSNSGSNESNQNDTSETRNLFCGGRNAPRNCKSSYKENIFDDTPSWLSEPKTTKATKTNKDARDQRRVLRDRNKTATTKAPKPTKTTLRKDSSSGKAEKKAPKKKAGNKPKLPLRKTTRRTKNDSASSIETSSINADSRLNFSEFDKYSLLISGSPKVTGEVFASPEIESAVSERTASHKDALTSTPHVEKEAKVKTCLRDRLTIAENSMSNLSNLSHIDESPPELPSRVTRRHGQPRVLPINENSILECSVQLEDMHLSSVSSIASSPTESGHNSSNIHGSVSKRNGRVNGYVEGLEDEPCKSPPNESVLSPVIPNHADVSSMHESQPDFSHVTHRRHKFDASDSSDRDSLCESSSNSQCENKRLTGNLFMQKVYRDKSNTDLSLGSQRVTRSHNVPDLASTASSGNSGSNKASTYNASQSLFDHTESPDVFSDPEPHLKSKDTQDMNVIEVEEDSSDSSGSSRESETDERSEKDYEEADWEPSELSEISEEEDCSLIIPTERPSGLLASINETPEEDSDCTEASSGNVDSESRRSSSEHSAISATNEHGQKSQNGILEEDSVSYHTCSSAMKTPESHRLPSTLVEEIQKSCRSLRVCLTPVRVRKSGRFVSPAEKLLALCNQTSYISFRQCIPPTMMKKCKKIGEGVYGEVFRTDRNRKSVALKIIPIEGDFPVNDEQQKTFEEILPEIVISKELSALRESSDFNTENFVQVRGVSIVQGSYPDTLLKQWDLYHKTKGSENDRPDVFGNEQLFIIFEFEDCGSDLESIKLTSLHQAKSILHQVTCAMAIAEEALEFEHRDLHWGNVLVKPTDVDTILYTLNGEDFEVDSHEIKVAVIDFTLSRLNKDGCNIFTDLSVDPTLFEGQGDYQFEVYRLMREENSNDWASHHPFTNVLWIHYLADKLIQGKSYPKTSSKDHQAMARQFRVFLREATNYNSALHLLAESPFFEDCILKES